MQRNQTRAQAAPILEVERPVARPGVESMVVVPFLLAAIVGPSAGVLATWLLVDALELFYRWWPTAGVLSLSFFLAAFWIQVADAKATLWSVERHLSLDLDRDGVVGEPETHDHIIVANGPMTGTWHDVTPGATGGWKRDRFVQFVRAIDGGGDTGYQRWEPVLGRDMYLEFRDGLMRAGLARWRDEDNHLLGWSASASADDIIRQVF